MAPGLHAVGYKPEFPLFYMERILMGIGNMLAGDDGVGALLARQAASKGAPGWLSIPCGTLPEAFAHRVRRERPRLLVIVDAAEMGLPPGEVRLLPKRRLGSAAIGTHGMALRLLVSELEKSAGSVRFIGIQPSRKGLGKCLSAPVRKAKNRLLELILTGDEAWLEGIEALG